MKSVRLFDYIEYQSEAYQVIAQSGTELALKSLSAGSVRHVSVLELLGDDTYEPDTPERLPLLEDLAMLDRLDDDVRAETEWRYRHVHEIIHGIEPTSLDSLHRGPRPEYRTSLTLQSKLASKELELSTSQSPLSARTLRKYVHSYKREGVNGLVDRRKVRNHVNGQRQDPGLITLIDAALDEQTEVSTGTVARVITLVSFRARQAGIEVPSRATMYRLVKSAEAGRHTFGDATTRHSNAKRPKRTFGRRTPLRPGELVEIDSTRLDLMVVYPDGTTGRPELTTMIDVATTDAECRDSSGYASESYMAEWKAQDEILEANTADLAAAYAANQAADLQIRQIISDLEQE